MPEPRSEVLTRTKWLDIHYDPHFVSASNAASILGLDRFKSAYTLYREKRGEIEPPKATINMRFGHYCEPFIAELYGEATGRNVSDPGDYAVYWHPQFPWLFSTLDRIIGSERGPGCLEMKKPGQFSKADWATDNTIQYQVQLQVQMACSGLQWGALAALVGNGDFYHSDIERNDRLIAQIIPRLAEFRDNCIAGNPPDVDGSASTEQTIKMLYPKDNGATIALPFEAREKHELREEVKAEISRLEKEEKALTSWFKDEIGNAKFGTMGDWTYTCGTRNVAECVRKAYTSRTLTRKKTGG